MRSMFVRLVMAALFVGCSAGLSLGAEGGKTTTEAKSGEGRYFEMRVYTAADGKFEDLHARFRNHTNTLFKKHGMDIIGYWVPTDAQKSKNTLVYILAYPSKEAREASWKAFNNDPEWKKVVEESQRNGKLVQKVESTFMTATDYSPIK